MNAKFITVGVYNNRRPAARHIERFMGELYAVATEMLDRLVEILHFQREMGAVSRRFQERFFSEGERVRPYLILDPESIRDIDGGCRGESENSLIEGAGTRLISGWIDNESKFSDFHR